MINDLITNSNIYFKRKCYTFNIAVRVYLEYFIRNKAEDRNF
jgi:hypothetical protein